MPISKCDAAKLRQLENWLRVKADSLSKQAAGRMISNDFRNATVAELKRDKARAEKMLGFAMTHAGTDLKGHKAYCTMQDRIREKLEAESMQLLEWADFLLRIAKEE